MKHMDDGNDDSSHSRLRSDAPGASALSGRRLDIDEDSPFSDLLAVYACSDQAQFAALGATSDIFVREVAHYLGLAGPDLSIHYDFTPFAETVRRHSDRGLPSKALPAGSSEKADGMSATTVQTTGTAKTARTGNRRTIGTPCRKKDRGAGRRMRREQREKTEAREHPEPLPDFPAFSPDSTFNGWAHQYTWAEDISEYCTLLGTTTSGAYKHITSAMTLVHGLPKFHKRCSDGDFTIEHVAFVTRRCRDVAFRYLPSIDDYLADRRADTTIETFKRSLALKIAATQPAQETLEKVAVRRRVDISSGDDGTAYLTLTGPAPELHACYRRVEALARSIYNGNTAAFGDQLNPGDTFDDDRGIDALMLDIFTRTQPQVKLRITSNNTTTGATSSTDFPLDAFYADPDGAPFSPHESPLDYIQRAFDQMNDETEPATSSEAQGRAVPENWMHDARIVDALMNSRSSVGGTSPGDSGQVDPGSAFWPPPRSASAAQFGDDSSCEYDGSSYAVNYELRLDMPTHEYWISQQARTVFTVPALTLLSPFLDNPDDDGIGESLAAGPRREARGETEAAVATRTPTVDKPSEECTDSDVCDLAGMLPDGSPLPADMARRLAGHASTWTRILTDPATGTPLDAKATTYTIPNNIRQTLAAQWLNCSMPGCPRRAQTSEVDHIIPFDHDNPEIGGLTQFGNLHYLCKRHHQAKTDRKFSVRMVEPGRLEYIFKHGITTEVLPPDNPINVEHARLFLEYFAKTPPPPSASPPTATPPTGTTVSTGTTGTTGSTPPATADSPAAPAARSKEDTPPTMQSQTAESTTVPNEYGQSPGWAEYVDPFSRQPGQNAKRWFWNTGEPPPF